MKPTVRSFSVGLLAAAFIMLIVYYFFDDTSAAEADFSTDEMIALLEEDGYRIVTEEEYISISVAKSEVENAQNEEDSQAEEKSEDKGNKETKNSDDEEDVENQDPEDTDKDKIVTKSITIEPGMVTSEISKMLAEEGLIDDAGDFNSYLLEHDYSLRVQMGEHELQSDMSFFEIAEAITR